MPETYNIPAVISKNATYTAEYIQAQYEYETVGVHAVPTDKDSNGLSHPIRVEAEKLVRRLQFRTKRHVPRMGVLLVGLGGNNGTTVVAGLMANKLGLTWNTKSGKKKANWYGSLILSSTVKLGMDMTTGKEYYVPLNSLLPMVQPDNIIIGGWDINNNYLGDAMRHSQVLDIDLQNQLYTKMQEIQPYPGVYIPDFIAENQKERANHILTGTLYEQMEIIRQNIREFKKENSLDKIIILWTGTTERYCNIIPGVHDTADNLVQAIKQNHSEISASTLYAVASILENCSYINGSPQNTFIPGVLELSRLRNVFIGGDDFKSGQTKLKSVLVDFLVSAGIKPTSIVSYNHLGNNDGRNLSSPNQFRSKEISKSTVVDDVVNSNSILYNNGEKPDHCVVIKYVPYVGDSKRALDEYSSEIFMNGLNTIVVHNTCEDSLLAAPLIIDLILLTELCDRIEIYDESCFDSNLTPTYEKFHHILSILSYLCKAPVVPNGTPIINALSSQRACIVNILKACIGLPPDNHMLLENKIYSIINKSHVPSDLPHFSTPSTASVQSTGDIEVI